MTALLGIFRTHRAASGGLPGTLLLVSIVLGSAESDFFPVAFSSFYESMFP